ncbi:MAG: alpha-amylase family glycosyl hydrolase [Porphyromonas sp.]|nr:alpha-amylase family glycosyl hydrolase [Porphyromonas sp.]
MKQKIFRKRGKISIYQVLPRLFGNSNKTRRPHGTLEENGSGHLSDFNRKALLSIGELGCTHIWYTGVIEHATKSDFPGIGHDHGAIVKGEAGSPYAIKDYYDVAPALVDNVEMRQEEFDDLVIRTHEAGLGVIIDFVPNHVARQYRSDSRPSHVRDFGAGDDTTRAFSSKNNFYYLPFESLQLPAGQQHLELNDYYEYPAKATGNDSFTAAPSVNDWYETVKLNYGVDYLNGRQTHFEPIPNTWRKMVEILTFWASRGVDGFRCDMAEMVPPAFWQWAITQVKGSFPEIIFIAEVYRPALYHTYVDAGFDYLYDKVGLYDHLIGVLKGERSARSITKAWQALDDGLRSRMLNFMENHDEQRLASDFIVGEGVRALPAVVVSSLISTSPLLVYFGQELGERGMDEEGFSGRDGRTTIFDYWSLDSMISWAGKERDYTGKELSETQQALRERYQSILTFAIQRRSIVEGGFFDLMYANPNLPDSLYAFLRSAEGEVSLVVANFSDEVATADISIPEHAFEILHIPDDTVWRVEELFTAAKSVSTLEVGKSIRLVVPARGAVVNCYCRV